MHNIDTTVAAVLRAQEEGFTAWILIVRNLKTGGRFISVRTVSPMAYQTVLKACAKDKNFGAYNSAILASIRKYGVEGHSISFHSAYKTKRQANAAKKLMVEAQAINRPEANMNYNRPIKALPVTDFVWLSEEEVAAKAKAKRARKAKVVTPVVQEQPSA